jgi:hypothetical protein
MGILDIENEIKKLPPEQMNELMKWLQYRADTCNDHIAKDAGADRTCSTGNKADLEKLFGTTETS